jgi:hypothetical protein
MSVRVNSNFSSEIQVRDYIALSAIGYRLSACSFGVQEVSSSSDRYTWPQSQSLIDLLQSHFMNVALPSLSAWLRRGHSEICRPKQSVVFILAMNNIAKPCVRLAQKALQVSKYTLRHDPSTA